MRRDLASFVLLGMPLLGMPLLLGASVPAATRHAAPPAAPCNDGHAAGRTATSAYSFTFHKDGGATATGQVRATLTYSTGALNRVKAIIQVIRLDQDVSAQLINPNPNPIPGLQLRVDQLYTNATPRCQSSQSTWETNIMSNGLVTRQMYSAARDLKSLYAKTTVSVKPDASSPWINNAIPLLELRTP